MHQRRYNTALFIRNGEVYGGKGHAHCCTLLIKDGCMACPPDTFLRASSHEERHDGMRGHIVQTPYSTLILQQHASNSRLNPACMPAATAASRRLQACPHTEPGPRTLTCQFHRGIPLLLLGLCLLLLPLALLPGLALLLLQLGILLHGPTQQATVCNECRKNAGSETA